MSMDSYFLGCQRHYSRGDPQKLRAVLHILATLNVPFELFESSSFPLAPSFVGELLQNVVSIASWVLFSCALIDQPEGGAAGPGPQRQASGGAPDSWLGPACHPGVGLGAQRVRCQGDDWRGRAGVGEASCARSPPWPRVRSSREQAHGCASRTLSCCFTMPTNTSASSAGHGTPGSVGAE